MRARVGHASAKQLERYDVTCMCTRRRRSKYEGMQNKLIGVLDGEGLGGQRWSHTSGDVVPSKTLSSTVNESGIAILAATSSNFDTESKCMFLVMLASESPLVPGNGRAGAKLGASEPGTAMPRMPELQIPLRGTNRFE